MDPWYRWVLACHMMRECIEKAQSNEVHVQTAIPLLQYYCNGRENVSPVL